MSTLREWCDLYGLPEDVDALARHLIGNAAATVGAYKLAAESLEARLNQLRDECIVDEYEDRAEAIWPYWTRRGQATVTDKGGE